jgi:hypothetical protein
VRSSPRNNRTAAAALVAIAVCGSGLSAHRRNEYLQAARLAIDPDRVEIVLDLTAGIAVADTVLAAIDRDGDASISPGEAKAYAATVLKALAVHVDGARLTLAVTDTSAPEVSAVRNGEGTLRITAVAAIPRLGPGLHRLRYRNGHRVDVGAYLANALVPASDRVTIEAQRRDVDQRELLVEYTLQSDGATRVRGGLVVGLVALSVWAAVWWGRRAPPTPDP